MKNYASRENCDSRAWWLGSYLYCTKLRQTSSSYRRRPFLFVGLRRKSKITLYPTHDRCVPLKDRMTRQIFDKRRLIVRRVVFKRRVVASKMNFRRINSIVLTSDVRLVSKDQLVSIESVNDRIDFAHRGKFGRIFGRHADGRFAFGRKTFAGLKVVDVIGRFNFEIFFARVGLDLGEVDNLVQKGWLRIKLP